jgi:hypothetical protein
MPSTLEAHAAALAAAALSIYLSRYREVCDIPTFTSKKVAPSPVSRTRGAQKMVLIDQPASALQRERKVGMPALLSLVDIALCSAPAQQQQHQQHQQRWQQAPWTTGSVDASRSAPQLLSTPLSPVLKSPAPQAVRRPKTPQPQLQTFSQLSVDRHRRKLSSSTLASALGGAALRADRPTSRSDRPMSSSSPLLRASPVGGRHAHLESMCSARPCARSEAQARRS